MASVTIKVAGLSELGRRLATLKTDMAVKIARSATAAAAQVVKKRAIQHVITSPSVETGSLRDAIIVKRLSKRDSNLTSEHIVTVRGRGKVTKKGKQKDAPHAHFIEFGTVNMPAEPFLRPALEEGKQQAIDAMVSKLKDRLAKAGA